MDRAKVSAGLACAVGPATQRPVASARPNASATANLPYALPAATSGYVRLATLVPIQMRMNTARADGIPPYVFGRRPEVERRWRPACLLRSRRNFSFMPNPVFQLRRLLADCGLDVGWPCWLLRGGTGGGMGGGPGGVLGGGGPMGGTVMADPPAMYADVMPSYSFW